MAMAHQGTHRRRPELGDVHESVGAAPEAVGAGDVVVLEAGERSAGAIEHAEPARKGLGHLAGDEGVVARLPAEFAHDESAPRTGDDGRWALHVVPDLEQLAAGTEALDAVVL